MNIELYIFFLYDDFYKNNIQAVINFHLKRFLFIDWNQHVGMDNFLFNLKYAFLICYEFDKYLLLHYMKIQRLDKIEIQAEELRLYLWIIMKHFYQFLLNY